MKHLRLALLLLAMRSLVSQELPRASLQGVVVDASTGVPLSKVRVTFSLNISNSQPYMALTAEDGRFSFSNVPAGNYRLLATRTTGYMQTQYVQRIPEREGLPIPLAPGQELSGIRLEMTPFGAIGGRIVDQSGKPIGNATVKVMRIQHRSGTTVLQSVQSSISNDLGEYRVFSLPPGQYYVRVVPPSLQALAGHIGSSITNHGGPSTQTFLQPAVTTPPRPDIPLGGIRYAPIYFSGTSQLESASPIDLAAGQDLKGIDIPLTLVRKVQVRGVTLNGATGQPVRVTTLQPYSFRELESEGLTLDNATGAFNFAAMDPGRYTLTAKTDDGMSGRMLLDVGNADIDNVKLTLWPEVELPGRIVAEGALASSLDPRNITIALDQVPWDWNLSPYARPVDASGSFVLKNVMRNADYRLRWDSTSVLLQNNAHVKAVRLNGVEIDETIRVDGPPKGILEIVVSADSGRVEGRVSGANVTIALVPDQHRNRLYSYRYTQSDLSGVFTFTNAEPGTYKVFAWDRVEVGAWQNAEFLRPYETRGIPVRVEAGQTSTVQPLVIR